MTPAIADGLRAKVRSEAGGLCAYCRSPEQLTGQTFEIDHIIPRAAGGATQPDNLCLCCSACNRFKAARTIGVDPVTMLQVPLFHPLRQIWSEHFEWRDSGALVAGCTPIGRATVETLHMNRPAIVQLRRYWIALHLHPPTTDVRDQF